MRREKLKMSTSERWFDKVEWQPAIIAPIEHVLKSHTRTAGMVARFAGEKIRVRRNAEGHASLAADAQRVLGCNGEHLEVHPEDADRLWPEFREDGSNISVCTCEIFMD